MFMLYVMLYGIFLFFLFCLQLWYFCLGQDTLGKEVFFWLKKGIIKIGWMDQCVDIGQLLWACFGNVTPLSTTVLDAGWKKTVCLWLSWKHSHNATKPHCPPFFTTIPAVAFSHTAGLIVLNMQTRRRFLTSTSGRREERGGVS